MAFSRKISDALGFFPILSRPTVFDLGEARVAALDLNEVSQGGGQVSDRITAVMYMLARQVLAKDFYMTQDVVHDMPAPSHVAMRDTVPVAAIRAYHQKRIKEIREDPKRICYDEFHRTKNAKMVREQVLLDMREGRKWQVDVMLASQDLNDFDDMMVKFATGVFVMDGGNAQTVDEIAARFGFNDPAEQYALQHRVHGPRAGGGTFMAKFSTTSGWYTMLLSATMGPIELWALSTTAEDVSVRNLLYDRIGPSRARRALALMYPQGSIKSVVEDRKQKMRASDQSWQETQVGSLYEQIALEVEVAAERMNI